MQHLCERDRDQGFGGGHSKARGRGDACGVSLHKQVVRTVSNVRIQNLRHARLQIWGGREVTPLDVILNVAAEPALLDFAVALPLGCVTRLDVSVIADP